MHLAAATSEIDIEQWIAANTAFCHRYQARLSVAACERNRDCSGGDLRCAGCGGLHSQPPPGQLLRLVPSNCSESPEPGESVTLPEDTCKRDAAATGFDLLGDADQDDEKLFSADDLDIELTDESMEALCPGLSQEIRDLLGEESSREPEKRHTERPGRKQYRDRVAVFMGRCHRCSGYMLNDRERQFSITDEEVYRCISCGWRISPTYAFNQGNR